MTEKLLSRIIDRSRIVSQTKNWGVLRQVLLIKS